MPASHDVFGDKRRDDFFVVTRYAPGDDTQHVVRRRTKIHVSRHALVWLKFSASLKLFEASRTDLFCFSVFR